MVDFKPKTKTKQDLYVIETRYRRGQRAVMRKDILFKVDDEFATVEVSRLRGQTGAEDILRRLDCTV